MTQECTSLREVKLNLVRELSKFKCPLNVRILDNGESASVQNPWIPQFFFQQCLMNKEAVINKILSFNHALPRRSVYARTLEFKEMSSAEKNLFFNKNHIQGAGQGQAFALYDEGIPLSAMVVKRAASNTDLKGFWELNRYASVSTVFVIGGFEKLLKEISQLLNVISWVSYADLMFSKGDIYYHTGWELNKECNPDYKYLYKSKLCHKFNFRIKRFREDSSLLFKEGLTEKELASLNGLIRVYDCGKLRFIKRLP